MKTSFPARRSSLHLVVIAAFLASLLGGALTVTPASAATSWIVDTNSDTVAVDGFCSLREALQAAETNLAVNECAAGSPTGPDIINFAAPYTITVGSPLIVSTELVINGLGVGNTIIQSSTCDPVYTPGGCTPATYRVFAVTAPAVFTLERVTVRHGKAVSDAGGGLTNSGGTVYINSASIEYNRADLGGGGIWNASGFLTVRFSSLNYNGTPAPPGGGGIYNNGTLTIASSTFTQNFVGDYGGALLNSGGSASATISNSTFSGNWGVNGGAIYTDNLMDLRNSTIASNSASSNGGGLYNSGTLHMLNTILGDNGGNDCYNAGGDAISTNTANLIETNGAAGHMCGTPAVTGDPALGGLTDNGGATLTLAISSSSPAYDAGDDATCAAYPVNSRDQRYAPRPAVDCDIGAYEYHAAPANDAFGAATPLGVLPYTNAIDTAGATTSASPADPDFVCVTGQKYQSVWYSLTSVVDLGLTVTTIGSNYDTVLAVWTGGSPPALTNEGCLDDLGSAFGGAYMRQSRVHFRAIAFTTYYIEVASYGFGAGNLQLNVQGTDDFDGDSRTDPAVFEKATGNWFAVGSTSGFMAPALGFGNDTSYIPVPGDYDGFGQTDPAVYEKATGNWFAVGSTAGFFAPALNFGSSSYIPVPGDYDGDGQTDPAVFEKATGHWFVIGSTLGFFTPALGFGNDTLYIPVPGDYDGDGWTDPAVFEKATGHWFVVGSSSGFFTPALGFGNDASYIPVPGDYDGDGATDPAVFEKATGNWFVVGSTAGLFSPALNFGNSTLYIPQPGEYDGDGWTDAAVYEKATGNWFVVGSSSGFFSPALGFGNASFLPVVPQSQ